MCFPAKDEKNQIIKHSYCKAIMGGSESTMGSYGSTSTAGSSQSTETDRKKMKAPGRNNEVIYRDEFTSNPKRYFQELRSKTDETNRKTMKAPGRNNEVIYRDVFTSDPKGYFRDLRKK